MRVCRTPALEAIAAADGPSAFALDEKLRIRSVSGERSEATGLEYRVSQRSTTRDGSVYAELDLHATTGPGPRFSTRVRLADGELAVLGETAAYPERRSERTGDEGQLYVIVRARLEPGAAG